MLAWIPILVVVTVAVAAGVVDFCRFRVPNALTFPLFFSALAFYAAVDGWAGLQWSLLGAATGFAVLFLMYLVGGMGAGDVKLLAGIGAWVGAAGALSVVLVAALAGGVYSLGLMVWHRKGRETLARFHVLLIQAATLGRYFAPEDRVQRLVLTPEGRKRAVPFGAMLAIGAVTVALFGARLMAMGTMK